MPAGGDDVDQTAQRSAEANRLADALGETAADPLRQLRRLIGACGGEVAWQLAEKAREVAAAGSERTRDGSRERTLGGIFFRLARDHLHANDRKAFYKVFSPPRSARAVAGWAERLPHVEQALLRKGEARSVKITITGRPGSVAHAHGYVVLGLTARKLPSLPRGLPTPDPAATSYAVYVADKHWRRVEQSMADQANVLIVEGFPHLDQATNVIAVFATNVTVKGAQATEGAG